PLKADTSTVNIANPASAVINSAGSTVIKTTATDAKRPKAINIAPFTMTDPYRLLSCSPASLDPQIAVIGPAIEALCPPRGATIKLAMPLMVVMELTGGRSEERRV